MTVDLVLPALASIERTVINPWIPGTFTTAFDNAPFSVGNTPSWVNLPGPASYDTTSAGEDDKAIEVIESRVYNCTLYVIPKGEGADGEAFAQCEPFFSLARAMFLAHPALLLTQGIVLLTLLSDDGTKGNLDYAGQLYYGITFRVQATTRTRNTFAAKE